MADKSTVTWGALAIGSALVFAGVWLYESWLPAHHGATVQDLESVDLARPMKDVKRSLPWAHEKSSRLEGHFHDVADYEGYEIRWDDTKKHAYRVVLEPSKHEEHTGKKEGEGKGAGVGPPSREHLARFLPDVDNDGSWSWGAVRFTFNAHTVEFRVDESEEPDLATFDKHVDIARRLLLAAAFGTNGPSQKELIDDIGIGYALHDIATLEGVNDLASSGSALKQRFPASVLDATSSIKIPVDHPVMRSVELRFNFIAPVRFRFTVTQAFETRRAAFLSCLEARAGKPQPLAYVDPSSNVGISLTVGATGVDAETTKKGVSQAAFASMLTAFDSCR